MPALSAVGYNTGFFGKHFHTYHTFAPTGSPECLRSSADYPDSWFGPYMGFQHVEMMLVGLTGSCLKNPLQASEHYERWFYADGKGDEKNRLYTENAGETKDAAQTWHSRLPVAWHNSTWTADRTINWLKERSMEFVTFCARVGYDPHHPFGTPEPGLIC